MKQASVTYDYIIAGAGCAGLSLLVHMIQSGNFSHKKILLVDKETKINNDRTWCFWETSPGLFEPIVNYQWNKVWFHETNFSKLMDIEPYHYKLIRGIDFYQFCFDLIRKQNNIDILTATVTEMYSDRTSSWIKTDGRQINADYIFNSIIFTKPVLNKKEHYLLQHFKGWIIEAEKNIFNAGEATLMDFRTDQQYGTTFVYVMPFSATRALVEYTLFTKDILQQEYYDKGLRKYIAEHLATSDYKIIEQEFGIIPMTNHRFKTANNNIINIGTAGGQTKASSGYTFRFIQKHSASIVAKLANDKHPAGNKTSMRFHFYDSVLLNILSSNTLPGQQIFSTLFQKNKPQQVLRFLDNETSLAAELGIISTLPTWPFLQAALRQL